MIAAAAAAVVVVALVVGGIVVAGGDDEPSSTTNGGSTSTVRFDGIPQDGAVLGADDARVTLIQFEDMQCPVCKQYSQEAFPGIVDEYVRPGEVKLRFVGLAFLGPDSEKALRYVLAAGKQGKLWEMSDVLYREQGDENTGWVTDELLQDAATELGLDFADLQSDAASPAVTQQLDSMSAEGQQREIPGTPWFYVQVGDDEPYEVQPTSLGIDAFRPILDDALRG